MAAIIFLRTETVVPMEDIGVDSWLFLSLLISPFP